MTHYFRNAFLSIGNLNITAILGSKIAQETAIFFSPSRSFFPKAFHDLSSLSKLSRLNNLERVQRRNHLVNQKHINMQLLLRNFVIMACKEMQVGENKIISCFYSLTFFCFFLRYLPFPPPALFFSIFFKQTILLFSATSLSVENLSNQQKVESSNMQNVYLQMNVSCCTFGSIAYWNCLPLMEV